MAGKPSGRYPHDRMQWASAWQAANNDWPALADAYAREFGEVIHVDKLRLAVRYWERGQAEAGVAVAPPTREANDLRAYMGKGRKLAEVCTRFGLEPDAALAALQSPPDDLFLAEQRDNWGELVYSWLKQTSYVLDIKPRIFDCYSDLETYFHICQFRDSADMIQIVPIYDAHYGHEAHDFERFLEYLKWIEETPNVYWFGGGDLMENALDDGRGYGYEQALKPETQLNDMTRFLAPIAHKGLFMLPGNHEERTYNRSGLEPTEQMCKQLNVPYFNAPVVVSLNWQGYTWNMYAAHGRGNAQTKGGKHNSAAKPKGFVDWLHFIVKGHVHDPMANSEAIQYPDLVNRRLATRLCHVVIAQPFLKYTSTYAHKAGYAPPGWGACNINIYANGDYDARKV